MAEAKEKGHDSIITIGGIQSNHARATAVASRYLGLPCHLVLRNSKALADSGALQGGSLERCVARVPSSRVRCKGARWKDVLLGCRALGCAARGLLKTTCC
jgi:hypothetical protein